MALSAQNTYTRIYAPLFDQRKLITNGSLFHALATGPNGFSIFTDQTVMDIDTIKAKKGASKFRDRGLDSALDGSTQKTSQGSRFDSKAMPFPLIQEQGNLTASQFSERMAGENPYQALSPMQRARVLAFNEHSSHVGDMFRKMEILAASSVLTGKHDFNEHGDELDWSRDAALTAAAVSAWDTADYDIIENDLMPAVDELNLKYVKGRLAVMGNTAFTKFVGNNKTQGFADNRRLAFHSIGDQSIVGSAPAWMSKLIEAGAVYQGWVKVGPRTLWIVTYDDFYLDAGTPVYYMPQDECMITDVDVRYDRYFGAGEMTSDAIDAQVYKEIFGVRPGSVSTADMFGKVQGAGVIDPRMFRFGAEKFGTRGYKIISQIAPIIAPVQVDGVALITGT